MFHLKRSICALLVFAALASASAAQAMNYYVATTGSDSNPGTLAQPFRTIVKGVSVLKPGETTFVRAGTYAESINTFQMNFPSGTSWTSAVTLAAYPGESVTLQGQIDLGAEAHQYIIINGLIIDAINTGMGDAVVINQGSNHIRFQNCEIKNGYSNGISIWWGNNNGLSSDYNEIINCKIHHSGRMGGYGPASQTGIADTAPGYGRGHGIYITTSHNIIRDNEFYDTGEWGIHQWTALPKFANNNLIERNTVTRSGYNTTRYGHTCCGGITVSGGTGTAIINNLVYGNLVNGIDMSNTAQNVKVFNNTIYNNGGNALQVITGGTGEVRNNITYPARNYIPGGGAVVSHTLTVNPQFVDATAKDFRILSTSPAIDAGMTLSAVTQDFARVPRPQGSAHDIGAYEFSGNQSNEAPATPRNLIAH